MSPRRNPSRPIHKRRKPAPEQVAEVEIIPTWLSDLIDLTPWQRSAYRGLMRMQAAEQSKVYTAAVEAQAWKQIGYTALDYISIDGVSIDYQHTDGGLESYHMGWIDHAGYTSDDGIHGYIDEPTPMMLGQHWIPAPHRYYWNDLYRSHRYWDDNPQPSHHYLADPQQQNNSPHQGGLIPTTTPPIKGWHYQTTPTPTPRREPPPWDR